MAVQRRQTRPYRRNAKQQENDSIAPVLIVQILICVLLVGFAFWGTHTENITHRETVSYIKEQLAEPISEVFALGEGETGEDFGFDYARKFFGSFLSLKTGLPQGGLVLYKAGAKNADLLAAPDWADLSPITANVPCYLPVSGYVTSFFGYREHPITGNLDFHTGVDIAAVEGTVINLAYSGKVIEVGSDDIYGNYIVVEHMGGFTTKYAHCLKVTAKEGVNLKAGERIALVGSTGMSTGAHLHFELRLNGVLVDPFWVLAEHQKVNEENNAV